MKSFSIGATMKASLSGCDGSPLKDMIESSETEIRGSFATQTTLPRERQQQFNYQKASKLEKEHYNLLLQYLNSTVHQPLSGIRYSGTDHLGMQHPSELLLPDKAELLSELKINGMSFTAVSKRECDGIVAIDVDKRDGKKDWTVGVIERLFRHRRQIKSGNEMQPEVSDFAIVHAYESSGIADPFHDFPYLMARIFRDSPSRTPMIVEARRIIGNVATCPLTLGSDSFRGTIVLSRVRNSYRHWKLT